MWHSLSRIFLERYSESNGSGAGRRAGMKAFSALSLSAMLLISAVGIAYMTSAAASFATFSGANGKIAFGSNRDGNTEIYVMDADGTDQTRLTNNNSSDLDPGWSPSGLRIAFESQRDGNTEIYVMDADGTDQVNLSNNAAPDSDPNWSPDGTKIAFSSLRNSNNDIYVMDADGTDQTRLTNATGIDAVPNWSPDGTKIAFVSNRDGNTEIYVMDADGTDQTRLTNNTADDNDPVWSPDGTRIAFRSDRSGGNNEIFVMNANGASPVNLSNNNATDNNPSWSPDGTKIIFASDRSGQFDIYAMDADGTDQVNLSNAAGLDNLPDFGPAAAPPPPPPDTTKLTVDITSPANGTKLTKGTFMVSGTASDNSGGSGVSKVEVSIDGGAFKLATGTTSWKFNVTSPLANGTHTITARATDNAGNNATDSVKVSVAHSGGGGGGGSKAKTFLITMNGTATGVKEVDGVVTTDTAVKPLQVRLRVTGDYQCGPKGHVQSMKDSLDGGVMINGKIHEFDKVVVTSRGADVIVKGKLDDGTKITAKLTFAKRSVKCDEATKGLDMDSTDNRMQIKMDKGAKYRIDPKAAEGVIKFR